MNQQYEEMIKTKPLEMIAKRINAQVLPDINHPMIENEMKKLSDMQSSLLDKIQNVE